MEIATGYDTGTLQEADLEYERRKKLRDAMSKNVACGGAAVGGVTGVVLDCAVEGTVPALMGIPHTFIALGAGAAAGCIAGYGCYKLIKPQNAAQLLRLPVGTEVELPGRNTDIPVLGREVSYTMGTPPPPQLLTAEIGGSFDQGGVVQPLMFRNMEGRTTNPTRDEQGTQRFENPLLDAPGTQTMEGRTINPMMTRTTNNPTFDPEALPPGTQSLKKGGLVRRTGLAYVHKGEYVVPTKDINKCNVCNKR